MNNGSARPKHMASERLASERIILIIGIFLLAIITSGCQGDDEVIPVITEMPTAVRATITPIVLPSATSQPTASNTAVPVEPTAGQPTVTSPVPSRTPLPTATPTPIPPPEPTFHIIESGDTLLGIAETYDIDVEALALANGYFSSSEMSLIAGQEVQIPLCEIHEVVSGNTLAGIALSCGVALDDLISINISELAQLGSLDAIPLTFLLLIPQESDIPEDLDLDIGFFSFKRNYTVDENKVIVKEVTRYRRKEISVEKYDKVKDFYDKLPQKTNQRIMAKKIENE